MLKISNIIVIGSGPAAVTSIIYASMAGANANPDDILHFAGPVPGGALTTTFQVDNYPGFLGIDGNELANKLMKHAEHFCQIKYETVINIKKENEVFIVTTDLGIYKTKFIIIASGSSPKKLLSAEKFDNKGVSYCHICDGHFFKNKIVAVAGGGNSALEAAIYLSAICSKVYLIHRRDEFRGLEMLQTKAKTIHNIELVLDSEITECHGDKYLEKIVVHNKKTNKNREIITNGLFINIGHVPQTSFAKNIVTLDHDGYIIVDANQKTSESHIYAAGDCCVPSNLDQKKFKQAVTAASEGCVAGLIIAELLKMI
jgi:thioredoxin reductase (NADPH)